MFDLMNPKRGPGKEIVRFRDEVDNLFKRFFDMDFPMSRRLFGDEEWAPRVDVSEGKSEITVKAEIPGCEAKDIDVKIDGRILTISGEKKQEKKDQDENYHRVERSYGCFRRMVELPAEVSHDGIDATYKKGVLKMVFKKTQETEAKKIEIKAG